MAQNSCVRRIWWRNLSRGVTPSLYWKTQPNCKCNSSMFNWKLIRGHGKSWDDITTLIALIPKLIETEWVSGQGDASSKMLICKGRRYQWHISRRVSFLITSLHSNILWIEREGLGVDRSISLTSSSARICWCVDSLLCMWLFLSLEIPVSWAKRLLELFSSASWQLQLWQLWL